MSVHSMHMTVGVNTGDDHMKASGVHEEDTDCKWSDRLDTNKALQMLDQLDDNICLLNHSKTSMSSKNSIKSSGSEERYSTKSLKTDTIRGNNWDQTQTRLLPIKDTYCWDCHKNGVDFSCKACLRSYHQKCSSLKRLLSQSVVDSKLCPECTDIMGAEEGTNPSGCMQWLNGNVEELSELLRYTIETVRAADKKNSFYDPVSATLYPEYRNLIVNPMDLSLIETNIHNKLYASTNSFLADIKWVYHNCIVFNSGVNQPLISEVKNILRVAKQECEEIEICPDCYRNYYTMEEDNYFAAVCRRPHAIVWAKLKGHPYWPAKVVRYNELRHEVDVRFFGTHDKCWLKPDKCYLMSRNYPNNKKPSKFDQNKFDEAIRDMNLHLDQLDQKHSGKFQFHDKHTVFSIDGMYLNDNTSTQMTCESNSDDKLMSSKKVLNTYNGIAFKTLKVKTSKFDVRNHLNDCHDANEDTSPPTKRYKGLNGSSKAQANRCLSQAIGVRHELNSSVDSENSSFDSKSVTPMESSHDLEDNSLEFDSRANHSPKAFTVPAMSHMLNTDESVVSEAHNHMDIKSNVVSQMTMDSTTDSLESLKKRVKVLEFKNRKLEEQNSELSVKLSSVEEENEDYKRTNEEFQRSTDEIKRKQWCTNCLKEAILPCCWNTCYCSVECQHKHWPIHSKSCRRRQPTK